MKRFVTLPILLLLLLPPAPAPGAKGKDRKSAKKALAALKAADRLVYRPLEHGLEDIRLEFPVVTRKGTLTCLWLHRAASGKRIARDVRTVKGVEDRKLRRAYAAGLKAFFHVVTWPILLRPFSEAAEGMDARWSDDRGGMTLLTKKKGSRAPFDAIRFVWDRQGLPREIVRILFREDEEEGPCREETMTTFVWEERGRYRVIGMINSDFYGVGTVARYRYRTVKKIILPSKVEWINPFDAPQDLIIRNLKVNEGISDEEFRKWR